MTHVTGPLQRRVARGRAQLEHRPTALVQYDASPVQLDLCRVAEIHTPAQRLPARVLGGAATVVFRAASDRCCVAVSRWVC